MEKSILSVVEGNNCCGCGSCVEACPKHIIQMKENERGFISAQISECAECINCGLCKKVCPVALPRLKAEYGNRVWYGHANNEELLKRSSSGAVFGMIASKLIDEEWIVFGASMDMNTGDVRHVSTEEHDLYEMLMSKYVQSDAFSSFADVEKKLEEGKNVLFCGTPCQVYGLKKYISEKEFKAKLITIDFFCHGVPSRRLFRDYYRALSNRMKGIFLYEFRTKNNGWPNMRVRVASNTKRKSIQLRSQFDKFSSLFLKNLTLNRSCADCPFREKHFADISIADFWGWKKITPAITDYKSGLSLVIVNNQVGENLFEQVMSEGTFTETDMAYAEYAYKRRNNIESMLDKIDLFYEDYEKYGWDGVSKKYASNLYWKAIKRKLHL